MRSPLHFLLLEDDPMDAELIKEILSGELEPFELVTVDTGKDFYSNIKQGDLDLILSDYMVPGFGGDAALKIAKNLCPEIPFIIVSGSLGEELAIETIKNGATDYVLKQRMERLVPAVQRALRESKEKIARKRVEEKLRLSEERFRLVAENSSDVIWTMDLNGHFTYVSPSVLQLRGYTVEEVMHQTIEETLTPESARIAREGVKYVIEAKTSDKPKRELRQLLEQPCKDGSTVWTEVSTTRMYDADGNFYGILGISRNITERRRMEEALQNEKERLAVTLRSIGDGVITTDTSGRILLLNRVAEKLTGWAQIEAIGRCSTEVFKIIHEKTRQPEIDPVQEALTTGSIVAPKNHTLLLAHNGTERMIEESCAPIRDRESKVIGTVLVFRDVTEQRKMTEELLKTSKLESLGVLAGGIAHDFNNLLSGIIGYFDLIRFNLENNFGVSKEEIIELLEEAEKAALRSKDLTHQLLTFARGGLPIKKATNLRQIIQDATSFVLHGSKVEPIFKLSEEIKLVEVDSGQLSQVIHNLVINATQAMPKGGYLRITAENLELGEGAITGLRKGNYVKIAFEDEGVGIPSENLQKIFDPYFTTKAEGNGLGLAICYSVIKKHEGHMTVKSEIGKGTTFNLYLPILKNWTEKGEILTRARTTLTPTNSNHEKKILIMDDEPLLRDLIKRALHKMGYQAELASEGQEALQLYKVCQEAGYPFDAVLLDLTIPGGLGGRETLVKLLEIDPQVKAVVCSGYSSDPVMSNYQDYGFKAVLLKPYRIEELVKVLERVTGS
jgi:PAS domain S-box-containing protein